MMNKLILAAVLAASTTAAFAKDGSKDFISFDAGNVDQVQMDLVKMVEATGVEMEAALQNAYDALAAFRREAHAAGWTFSWQEAALAGQIPWSPIMNLPSLTAFWDANDDYLRARDAYNAAQDDLNNFQEELNGK